MSEDINAIAKLIDPSAFREGQTEIESLITGQRRYDARALAKYVLPAVAVARSEGYRAGMMRAAEIARERLKTYDEEELPTREQGALVYHIICGIRAEAEKETK